MRSLILILLGGVLAAAIGPRETAVIINGESEDSRVIAERYMALRGIPEEQAVTITGLPEGHKISLEAFRRDVLGAIEAVLVERGLADRIACLAYAADFPTAVTFPRDKQLQRWQNGPGAITAMTLLAPMLDDGRAAIAAPFANPYAERLARPGAAEDRAVLRLPAYRAAMEDLAADRHAEAATALAELAEGHASPHLLYNLACAQALTGEVEAAEASLRRAVEAGWSNRAHTAKDPDLAPLHERPGWDALLQAIDTAKGSIRPPPSEGFTPLPAKGDGPPGRLAMLLMPTRGRGLTREAALRELERSVSADGSAPQGTFYFMVSGDRARTGPRQPLFAAAAATLRELGFEAEVRKGVLPPEGAEVAGAVVGIAGFDWGKSGAEILPGAWCDHLTSFGGALQEKAGQTPLTAFLDAGAAGAGGTVSEPLNLPVKFPSPFLHIHRVRGLSLVEAVHRTMPCPFQYLVAGDPLSRPWPAAEADGAGDIP